MGNKPKVTGRQRSEFIWGWLFILPTMIGLIVLNIIPIFQTIYQSFFKTGDFGKGNIFVGGANYAKVFADTEVWQALINTLKYAVVEVPLSIIISLVLAVFLNGKIKGKSTFRTIFFLPMVAAPAAIAMVWKWLYNSEFGLLNHILPGKTNWVSDPKIAIYSIAVIGIWSIIGYNMVLFLAGLQEVPKDYYEAAAIDGATGVQQFFSITIPLVSPTIFFVLVTRIIAAMQVFDVIYMVIDNNNPALNKTQSLVCLFYKYSFQQSNKGYGATVVVVLLVVIMFFTVLQMIGQKKWVHYN
ncbi:multiple sugar transport system permease protein [Pseudobutyrivibrio sp. YE44]|uniref:carbohydrate ABC transporter permease n=1 Tax=Pseudobutyrivibrio sp. YE44 TaxID=1520802 RepID=UPI00088E26A0|nr:sugar ABC transporter permease [Pseudobutyrivibrio sp. YE44]SDB25124.1 multiple sugar transport system permease protein [Pseudobutyrivibrio sp. YE44]